MIVQSVIYWLVMAFLLIYTLHKFNYTKSENYLYIILMQVSLLAIHIVCLVVGLKIDWYIQLIIFLFAFLLPASIVFADFNRVDLDEYISLKLGDFYAKRGRYSKAISKYKKALTKNPDNATTYAKLGRMYKLSGDRRTAFDRFAKAIELDRDDFKSYYEIGSIFNDMGKYADAEVVLNNALRIRPDYIPASLVLGEVLSTQGKYDQAITAFSNSFLYSSLLLPTSLTGLT